MGFKGFKKKICADGTVELYCRAQQYVIGIPVKLAGNISAGERGLHYCLTLHDVFRYYPLAEDTVYGRVLDSSSNSIMDDSLPGVRCTDCLTLLELLNGEIETTGGTYHFQDGSLWKYTDPGITKWFHNGQLHRVNGPAVELGNGDKEWYYEGQLHRDDGPAVERADGTKVWCWRGEVRCEIAASEPTPTSTAAPHKELPTLTRNHVERLRQGLEHTSEMFRTAEYEEWDDCGVPIKSADGSNITPTCRKKLLKIMSARQTICDELYLRATLAGISPADYIALAEQQFCQLSLPCYELMQYSATSSLRHTIECFLETAKRASDTQRKTSNGQLYEVSRHGVTVQTLVGTKVVAGNFYLQIYPDGSGRAYVWVGSPKQDWHTEHLYDERLEGKPHRYVYYYLQPEGHLIFNDDHGRNYPRQPNERAYYTLYEFCSLLVAEIRLCMWGEIRTPSTNVNVCVTTGY